MPLATSTLTGLEQPSRPHLRYAGTYRHGKTYKRGQTVSFRGGLWLALGATDTKPGTGDWKLVVKSGAFGPRDETRTDDQ
jgi:hypothetical protein